MFELVFLVIIYLIFGMTGIWVLLGLFGAVLALALFGAIVDAAERMDK